MEKITFKEFLKEAPIGDYQTFGKFPKPSSFTGKTDPMLVSSEKAIKNVRKKFGNTPYTLNMYFVNRPKMGSHTETGAVTLDFVRKNIGDDVANAIEPHYQEEMNINIVYVGNQGAAKVPMTPWIMAHRMAHALATYGMRSDVKKVSGQRRQFYSFEEVERSVYDAMDEIFTDVYGLQADYRAPAVRGFGFGPDNSSKEGKYMKFFFYEICKFKSARERNMRTPFEGFMELFAQWMITGKIEFNPLPKSFGSNAKFGKGFKAHSRISDEERAEYDYILNSLSNTLDYYFNLLLDEATQFILVM